MKYLLNCQKIYGEYTLKVKNVKNYNKNMDIKLNLHLNQRCQRNKNSFHLGGRNTQKITNSLFVILFLYFCFVEYKLCFMKIKFIYYSKEYLCCNSSKFVLTFFIYI